MKWNDGPHIFLLAYNCFDHVMLASAVPSGSAICIHVSPPAWTSLLPAPPQSYSSRSSQGTKLRSLCHTSDCHLSFTFLSALPEHTLLKKTEKEILACFIVFESLTLSSNDYNKKPDLETHLPLRGRLCICLQLSPFPATTDTHPLYFGWFL